MRSAVVVEVEAAGAEVVVDVDTAGLEQAANVTTNKIQRFTFSTSTHDRRFQCPQKGRPSRGVVGFETSHDEHAHV